MKELFTWWMTISPWAFPAFWGALALYAWMRRRHGLGVLLVIACASELFLSYLFSLPSFTDGSDPITLFSTLYAKQPLFMVASLLPTAVNLSLAAAIALLLRSASKPSGRY